MKTLPVEKLDTSRPHGVVYGENTGNIHYEQKALGIQSWPYDAHGNLVHAALTEQQKKKLQERRDLAAKMAKDAPKEAAVAVPATPITEDLEDGERSGTDPVVPEDDEINLLMWLKGEVRYKPFEVQAALKKRYGANIPRLQDAALYLVEKQNLLPRAQVHASVLPALATA